MENATDDIVIEKQYQMLKGGTQEAKIEALEYQEKTSNKNPDLW